MSEHFAQDNKQLWKMPDKIESWKMKLWFQTWSAVFTFEVDIKEIFQ